MNEQAEFLAPPELRTWAEIDGEALLHNLAALRARIGTAVGMMAVLKANAYGHGMPVLARLLADRVEMFGVANATEARQLRAAAPSVDASRIYLLGPVLPSERAQIVADGFVPTVSSLEEAASFGALFLHQNPGGAFPLHLTIDTGMGRIGIWEDAAIETARAILELPGVALCGVASHLPVADEDEAFTRAELTRFEALLEKIRALSPRPILGHVENSAGALGWPAHACAMVRAGLLLYGSAPLAEFQERLRPVLTWKTRVSLVREVGAGRGISYGRTFITPHPMRIATLAVGYADGYRRHLAHQDASVLIRGRRCPLLGRVTMDQILVDVTSLPDVAPGEEAVLLGAQGNEEIFAHELAQKAGTIAWDIFTGIGQRVERLYPT